MRVSGGGGGFGGVTKKDVGVIRRYGRDCQKCQSVIKMPCFIFNGQPDSDLRYATRDTQKVPKSHGTPNNILAGDLKLALTQWRLLALQSSNAGGSGLV